MRKDINLHDLLTYENVLKRDLRQIAFSISEFERLKKHKILVTGAGGSIGSRICHFLNSIEGVDFLATDRDESSLHSLSLDLSRRALFDTDSFMLMDIKDSQDIEKIFTNYRPDIVIHAAALKHLSVLERQPDQALKTNVYGTANLIEASLNFNIKTFINISTDKAAQATSVLGKSKFLAEAYGVWKGRDIDFRSCRFGNVFASRGSVIETFSSQMLKGDPITLTQRDVSRFFMHRDEAAYLSVKSILVEGENVFVFDMGEPVFLADVIKNMQAILKTGSSVVETGIRKGEKTSESLLNVDESSAPTDDPFITTASFSPKTNLEKLGTFVENRNSEILLDFLMS